MRRRMLTGQHAVHQGVNATPLIDVVMCLIISLLVGKLASDRGAAVRLPESRAGTRNRPRPSWLSRSRRCRLPIVTDAASPARAGSAAIGVEVEVDGKTLQSSKDLESACGPNSPPTCRRRSRSRRPRPEFRGGRAGAPRAGTPGTRSDAWRRRKPHEHRAHPTQEQGPARATRCTTTPLHFGPNMTPMVDVVMVILIFFMASAAFMGDEWFLHGDPVRSGRGTATNKPERSAGPAAHAPGRPVGRRPQRSDDRDGAGPRSRRCRRSWTAWRPSRRARRPARWKWSSGRRGRCRTGTWCMLACDAAGIVKVGIQRQAGCRQRPAGGRRGVTPGGAR